MKKFFSNIVDIFLILAIIWIGISMDDFILSLLIGTFPLLARGLARIFTRKSPALEVILLIGLWIYCLPYINTDLEQLLVTASGIGLLGVICGIIFAAYNILIFKSLYSYRLFFIKKNKKPLTITLFLHH